MDVVCSHLETKKREFLDLMIRISMDLTIFLYFINRHLRIYKKSKKKKYKNQEIAIDFEGILISKNLSVQKLAEISNRVIRSKT